MRPKECRLVLAQDGDNQCVAIELERYTSPDPNNTRLTRSYALVVKAPNGAGVLTAPHPYIVDAKTIRPYGLHKETSAQHQDALEQANERIEELESAIRRHRSQKYGPGGVRRGYTTDLDLYRVLEDPQ